jgi:hypothetical protein
LTFGRWQPLDSAVAPDGGGTLQARAPAVLDYPRGKSAMLYYDGDERSLAAALARLRAIAAAHKNSGTLVRFAAGAAAAAELPRLLADFERRFGSAPRWNAP